MNRDELELWLQHPVTRWFLAELDKEEMNPDNTWFCAGNWDEVCVKRGERLILMQIAELLKPSNYD